MLDPDANGMYIIAASSRHDHEGLHAPPTRETKYESRLSIRNPAHALPLASRGERQPRRDTVWVLCVLYSTMRLATPSVHTSIFEFLCRAERSRSDRSAAQTCRTSLC